MLELPDLAQQIRLWLLLCEPANQDMAMMLTTNLGEANLQHAERTDKVNSGHHAVPSRNMAGNNDSDNHTS